jgi:beta-phosphoglucomutase-like phosphatase (HAD superfamily)
VLGLPDGIRGCLFDLDGVLTRTAQIHDAAWQEMFDGYLRERSRRTGEPFVAFDPVADYESFVDGKPRADETRSFLASRGTELPAGSPGDPPGAETVGGLSNRKNEILLRRIREGGKPAPDTFLAEARALGLEPGAAAVFEDAQAGVAAGRAGGFGFVVGVDRLGQAAGLREHGADVVVADLAELLDNS